jgi:hypothetical protein
MLTDSNINIFRQGEEFIVISQFLNKEFSHIQADPFGPTYKIISIPYLSASVSPWLGNMFFQGLWIQTA